MEEQKGKVVKMQSTTKETERPEKMSYEQLENVAHQLSEQTKQLYMKLQQLYMKLQAANMDNMFKRLEYLFKVVEDGHMFKQDFLEKCIAEIEELMTVPEETEEDNKEEETPDIKTGE